MNAPIVSLKAPRSQRLKTATHQTHDALDRRIMAADIFASREHFAGFLRVQYRFHRDIEHLYADAALAALLPALAERARLLKIANDLSDLGHGVPEPVAPPATLGQGIWHSLGWLYVAEGSNLGGTVLFKMARDQLGLHRGFGAGHLAGHPEGAARHWRQFTQALDSIAMDDLQEQQVIDGACQAFVTVRGYVEQELPRVADAQASSA